MQWLLGDSMSTAEFFETHWEKKPLVVKRGRLGTLHVVVPWSQLGSKPVTVTVDELVPRGWSHHRPLLPS